MKEKARTNYQDFLKLVAIITMIIDHFGVFIYPKYFLMRLIGRVAMPIFCFFAGYNFKGKPSKDVLSYALLMTAYSYCIMLSFTTSNILVPIFIGQVYLSLLGSRMKTLEAGYAHIIFLCLLWPFTCKILDYGTVPIALMVAGYMAKQGNKYLYICITLFISVMHTFAVFGLHYTTILTTGCSFLLLVAARFEQPISINIRFITRNSLFIYFAHFCMIQFYWLFFIISPDYYFYLYDQIKNYFFAF